MYRLARPRAWWYQLRGLPLVNSECVCPQCNSSFVVTRGSAMPSAMNLYHPSLKSLQATPTSALELPYKLYPTVVCAVICPMIRPQRYNTLQKPISGYQPQVGSDRVPLINITVRTLGNGQSNTSRSVSPRPNVLPRLLTVNNDCSEAASSAVHLEANQHHALHLQLRLRPCRNPDRTRNMYSSTIATSKRKHQPRTCSFHRTASVVNRQLWLRRVLYERPKQKRQVRKIRTSKFR